MEYSRTLGENSDRPLHGEKVMAMARIAERNRPCSLCDQGPAGRKSWAESAADENVVIHIPDRCLSRPSVVKHVVRLPVPVKVGCRHQRPASGNGRPVSSSNARWSG